MTSYSTSWENAISRTFAPFIHKSAADDTQVAVLTKLTAYKKQKQIREYQ